MIPLFYYDNPNLGDSLSPWIVENLTGERIVYKYPYSVGNVYRKLLTSVHLLLIGKWRLAFKQFSFSFHPIIIAVGSLLEHSTTKCIVWGTGMAQPSKTPQGGRFIMTRGQLSRKVLLDNGFKVESEICGDPALLMPLLYHPQVSTVSGRIGIIPHVSEFDVAKEKLSENDVFFFIDFRTNNVENTISQLLTCEYVYSSSLHGLILCHAYGIPCSWFQINVFKGGNFKFHDHFTAVGIHPYEPLSLSDIQKGKRVDSLNEKANPEVIKDIQIELIKRVPFTVKKI